MIETASKIVQINEMEKEEGSDDSKFIGIFADIKSQHKGDLKRSAKQCDILRKEVEESPKRNLNRKSLGGVHHG